MRFYQFSMRNYAFTRLICSSALCGICLSVRSCVSGSHTFLVVTHSYVLQVTHAFLGMLPLCFLYTWPNNLQYRILYQLSCALADSFWLSWCHHDMWAILSTKVAHIEHVEKNGLRRWMNANLNRHFVIAYGVHCIFIKTLITKNTFYSWKLFFHVNSRERKDTKIKSMPGISNVRSIGEDMKIRINKV